MPIKDPPTLKSYFNTGDIPSEANYVDLIDTLFGIAGGEIHEGPGIDIVTEDLNKTIGLGLDTILVSHADGSPASEFSVTTNGLTSCLSSCQDGDVVWLPNRIFTLDLTVPSGVRLTTLGNCKIIGTITLEDKASIEKLTIAPSKNQNGSPLIGVTGSGLGVSDIYSCVVVPVNSGTGGVNAIRADGYYTLRVHESFLDGRGTSSGAGYAAFRSSSSTIYIEGGTCLGSDPDYPFNE